MGEDAKAARKEYMKSYRENNREKLNALARDWYKNNPDKAKAINERYWNKKAQETNISSN